MDAPLIEFNNVDVCLEGQRVLSDVTWRLRRAEHWAVLGGNGAGKSTFLKLVRGEIAPAPGKGGRIYRLDATPQSTAIGIKEQMPLVSPEAQDRYLQLEWKRRVDEVIFSGFGGADYLYRKISPPQRELAAQLVRQFGVEHLWPRDVQELSTGELRRVLIVRALVRRPPVLLLDEVCDGLDAPTRRMLLAALDRTAKGGTQIIYTTHRPEELIPALTHALVFENGRILECSDPAPAGPLLSPRLSNPPSKKAATRRRTPKRPLIRFVGADVFLQRKRVLRDVTWELRPGENWAIFGANGSGKTTFLKLICGDIHPAFGSLVQRFNFTARNTLWDIRKQIGFISPALQANYRTRLTGAQVVTSGFFSSVGLINRVTRKQQRKVDALLEAFGAARLGAMPIMTMSYGGFRKILLLRALVHDPAVVVCDEPFDGLDSAAKEAFCAALDRVAENGTRVVTITHHMNDLPRCTTHALLLENGRIVCQGELVRVRRHPAMRQLFKDE